MKLLTDLMPKDYRLCWMRHKYKPINGYPLVLYKHEGAPVKKNTPLPPAGSDYEKFEFEEWWKDDDRKLMSLGACKSKQNKVEMQNTIQSVR